MSEKTEAQALETTEAKPATAPGVPTEVVELLVEGIQVFH